MRTWLILASLFGVVFTSVVKRPKLAEGECDLYGKVMKAGQEIPVPGSCAVYVCRKLESTNYFVDIKSCRNYYMGYIKKGEPEPDPKSYPGCCRPRRIVSGFSW
ncbi:hypothetical protein GE061_019448 [Apolygus lucorum]|uniref:Single domain-containing protein n=1 Tax=Apolygus lucorum TaxID=248454 RepID=A0A6A4JJ00_APOLU|nr:hypothetical protein GE061_019448 [Apolygus lucorum]